MGAGLALERLCLREGAGGRGQVFGDARPCLLVDESDRSGGLGGGGEKRMGGMLDRERGARPLNAPLGLTN